MNKPRQTNIITVWAIGIALFTVLTLLNVLVFNGLQINNKLESRNSGERRINDFMNLLREYDSFSKAMDEYATRYGDIILGVGRYSKAGENQLSLGSVPGRLDSNLDGISFSEPRKYFYDVEDRSLVILQIAPPRHRDRPPAPPEEEGKDEELRRDINIPQDFSVFYWNIRQPEYWARLYFYIFLFPVIEAVLAFGIVFVLRLVIKNSEFKHRIEEQKNLVIIGTAASMIAHEIKNPLSTIRLQTAIMEKTPGGDISRELNIINEETGRLAMLTQQVNDFLRDPVGTPEIIDPIIEMTEYASRVLKRPFEVIVMHRDLSVFFDRVRFQSVAENLLINAVESGSAIEDITVSLAKKGKYVLIAVRDRGKGLPENVIRRIYDPFFTTKSKGTGVGLAVANRFVEAAKGTLTIQNREDGGAEAIMEIPEHKK